MPDDTVVTGQDVHSQNALLRQILEGVLDSIVALDERGRPTLINTAAARAFGYSPDEFLQLRPAALFPPKSPDGAEQEVVKAFAGQKTWFGPGIARRKDGSTFPALIFLSCADLGNLPPGDEARLMSDSPARAGAGAILHVRDMAEQQRMMDRLKYLSITDDLTGVYNVRYFWARLRYEFARSVRYKQPLACLMADLDRFKEINDKYGHQAGDEVLQQVAKTMSSTVREVDILARYGGEEFGIILPNTGAAGAVKCAENVRNAVATADFKVGQVGGAVPPATVRVSVSIGVADLTADISNEEQLASRADEALYRAKREGRNRASLWSAPSLPENL